MPAGLSFNLFGIPVRIDPSFLLVSVFLGIGLNSLPLLVTWVIVVTVSVLLHEMGHAVTLRVFERRPTIALQWIGGVTSAPGTLSPRRQLVVSLAGPLSALFLLGVPALLIASGTPDDGSTWAFLLREVGWVNIAWSLFNLVPVLPLDGGNVTVSALQLVIGNRAWRVTHVISAVVAAAVAVIAFAVGPEFIFVSLFAAFLASFNLRSLKAVRPAEEQADINSGYQAIGRNDAMTAVALAERVMAAAPADPVLAAAVELDAWARIYAGDVPGARAVLNHLPAGTSANPFVVGSIALLEGRRDLALDSLASGFRTVQFGPWSSIVAGLVARYGMTAALVDRLVDDQRVAVGALLQLQSHLHYAGFYADAARVGERVYELAPPQPGQAAYNIACDHARAGDGDVAIAWLERAASLGFATRQQVADDPDLASLHDDSRFAELLSRMSSPAAPPPA